MKLAWMLLLAASVLALGCESLSSHHKSKNIAPDSAQWVARENLQKLPCTDRGVFDWEGGDGNGRLISWSTVCVNGAMVITDRTAEARAWQAKWSAHKTAVRTYYPVSISDLAAGRNSHTHIRVTGKVVLVKHEADGDLHIRLSDGKNWIVAECIPKLPCAEPKVGQTMTVQGISRFDAKHRWYEVHPIENWK